MILIYIVGGLIGALILFFIAFFVVCLWERQYLSGDVEPASEPFPYRAVLLGLARFMDPQETTIRMTVRGALKHWQSMVGTMGKLDELQPRAGVRRAGAR